MQKCRESPDHKTTMGYVLKQLVLAYEAINSFSPVYPDNGTCTKQRCDIERKCKSHHAEGY